jgi:CRP-like cAMP-binding protein
VLRLSAGQYFGERALLTNARRAANVVACGEVSLLQLRRDDLEAALGPLQMLLDMEQAWRDKLPIQREAVQKKFVLAFDRQSSISMDELKSAGVLYSTDCSVLMLMHYKPGDVVLTVRLTSVADVIALQRQKQVRWCCVMLWVGCRRCCVHMVLVGCSKLPAHALISRCSLAMASFHVHGIHCFQNGGHRPLKQQNVCSVNLS